MTDIIARMRVNITSRPFAAFVLSSDDYRAFVREWLAAQPELREPVPTSFENTPIVVARDARRSYAMTQDDPPELWVL